MSTATMPRARYRRPVLPGGMTQVTDDNAALLYRVAAEGSALRLLALAEMGRRDVADERAAKAQARKDKARAKRRAARAEYDLWVHAQWLAAEAACNGYLLSAAGRNLVADPAALWPMARRLSDRYASEELRDWWADHPKMTFAEWQEQAREKRPEVKQEESV